MLTDDLTRSDSHAEDSTAQISGATPAVLSQNSGSDPRWSSSRSRSTPVRGLLN
jgi:hypothetical protein